MAHHAAFPAVGTPLPLVLPGHRGTVAPLLAAADASSTAPGRQVLHVGLNPQNTVVDAASHTLYVSGNNFVSVIDTTTCSARSRSKCGRTPPRIPIPFAAGMVVDAATRTLYVTEPNTNTVAVVDIATCNAAVQSGCSHPVATVHVGSVPFAADVDQATDTIYVANYGNGAATAISVIDGGSCNARHPAGCAVAPASVTVGTAPNGLVVDQATHAVYVALLAPSGAQRLAVVDGASCNARTTAGCGQRPRTVAAGQANESASTGMAIDQRTETLYVANWPVGTVMMFDTATCAVATTSGCADRKVARLGEYPSAVAVDEATQTVYVSSVSDADVSVVNAATCNAHRTAGCAPGRQRRFRVGIGPWDVTVDPAAGTLYVPNGDSNTVSVLDGATCNATRSSGCTPYPATISLGLTSYPFGFALDPATDSVYVADSSITAAGNRVSVINATTCHAGRTAGCGRTPPSTTVGTNPNEAVFDPTTHTVYVSNYMSNTASVISTTTCNAVHPAGCRRRTATIKVPGGPFGIAVDVATDTVYVTGVNNGDLSIVNGATCNAAHHAGCGQRPRQIPVGANARGVAVNPATHTVYVTTTGAFGGPALHTMSVFDAATCNARVASGCAHPQRVGVGTNPWGIALDLATDTVYVVDDNGFSGAGSVRVINGALCNATHHRRCGRTASTIAVGETPIVPAVDQATGWLYVPNEADATVSMVDGATCNATDQAGCGRQSSTFVVDGLPDEVLVDDATGTVYVTSHDHGTVGVLRAVR